MEGRRSRSSSSSGGRSRRIPVAAALRTLEQEEGERQVVVVRARVSSRRRESGKGDLREGPGAQGDDDASDAPDDLKQQQAAPKYVYRDLKGVAMACTILSLWSVAFYYAHFCVRLGPTTATAAAAATATPAPSPWWVVALTFAALTHLYAGLFVTAHDAIHGAVCRRHRWLNDLLGTACITCYAFFSFRALHSEHWRHHHWTGRSRQRAAFGAAAAANGGAEKEEEQEQYDPDYPPNDDARLLPWFASFMRHYSTPGQYLRTGAAVAALMLVGAPYANLCLFMCASAVLAAFQLFYWGTYRPHRPDAAALKAHAKQVRKEGGGKGAASAAVMPWPRARSAPYPLPLLFAQAYFFNLHYEHHRWPSCPWWDLPRVRREAREVVRVVAEKLEAEGAEPY